MKASNSRRPAWAALFLTLALAPAAAIADNRSWDWRSGDCGGSSGGLLEVARVALGEGLAALGRPADAEPLLVAGYEALRDGRGAEHRQTREAARGLAALYRGWGREDDARRYEALLTAGR